MLSTFPRICRQKLSFAKVVPVYNTKVYVVRCYDYDYVPSNFIFISIFRDANLSKFYVISPPSHNNNDNLLTNLLTYLLTYLVTYFIYLFIHGKIFSIYYNKKFHYNYNVHCFTRLLCGSPTGTYHIVGQFPF